MDRYLLIRKYEFKAGAGNASYYYWFYLLSWKILGSN